MLEDCPLYYYLSHLYYPFIWIEGHWKGSPNSILCSALRKEYLWYLEDHKWYWKFEIGVVVFNSSIWPLLPLVSWVCNLCFSSKSLFFVQLLFWGIYNVISNNQIRTISKQSILSLIYMFFYIRILSMLFLIFSLIMGLRI